MKRNRRAAYDPHLDALIAWRVLRSLHETYCKGRDPFWKQRHKDFMKHEAEAELRYRGTH